MSSIKAFIKDPSEDLLNYFVKQQLWELVDHFKISEIDKKIRKKELRSVVKDWLCENSLMVASPQRKRDIDAKGDLDIFSGLAFEERKEILQMQQLHDKELIKETKRYELKIVLRQRKIEFEQKLEAEKSARDHELQVERLRLEGRMVSDAGERGLSLSGGFDLASNLRLLPKFNEHVPRCFFCLYSKLCPKKEIG